VKGRTISLIKVRTLPLQITIPYKKSIQPSLVLHNRSLYCLPYDPATIQQLSYHLYSFSQFVCTNSIVQNWSRLSAASVHIPVVIQSVSFLSQRHTNLYHSCIIFQPYDLISTAVFKPYHLYFTIQLLHIKLQRGLAARLIPSVVSQSSATKLYDIVPLSVCYHTIMSLHNRCSCCLYCCY